MRLKFLLFLTMATASHSASIRGAGDDFMQERHLASPYYSTLDMSVLGASSPDAAIGNPLKGLLTSPAWTGGNSAASIPSTLEFYYVGMDQIMTGDNAFSWSFLDQTLADAASRNNHVIWRVFCHYPGQPLRVPQYLIDAGIKLNATASDGISPQYDDPILLKAFQQLIVALGQRYDGNKSIGFIQLGLLGKWGEWHTYPDANLLSDSTKNQVAAWYDAAFQTTRLQVRAPLASAYSSNIGLHDDSFGFSTLGTIDWFFMPSVVSAGQSDFWKKSVMGGETRPELQGTIFSPDYQAGSDVYKQDFTQCVESTHATYMMHNDAFINGGYSGTQLDNARQAHARMGYNFEVSSVAVASPSAGTVSIDVTVRQTGVAPFYYPLSLALNCPGAVQAASGVDSLIQSGDSKVFSFTNIPADSTCLGNVKLTLESAFAYAGRPIKFAQGDGTVSFSLPLPGSSTIVVPPITPPIASPIAPPASGPSAAPITALIAPPVPAPVALTALAAVSFFAEARMLPDGSRFNISGTTKVYNANVTIGGIAGYAGELFRHARWGPRGFTYTVSGFPPGSSNNITMGFAEIYKQNCAIGKRIFNVLSNGASFMSNLDVFANAGCNKPYTKTRTVTANAAGNIELKFVAVQENPFISIIDISPL